MEGRKKKHKREIEISVYQFTEAESKSARTESTGLKTHFHCPKKGKAGKGKMFSMLACVGESAIVH